MSTHRIEFQFTVSALRSLDELVCAYEISGKDQVARRAEMVRLALGTYYESVVDHGFPPHFLPADSDASGTTLADRLLLGLMGVGAEVKESPEETVAIQWDFSDSARLALDELVQRTACRTRGEVVRNALTYSYQLLQAV